MKYLTLLLAILCFSSAISCKRSISKGHRPAQSLSPDERFRQSAATEWSTAFPLGVVWQNPPLSDESALRDTLSRLHEHHVSLIWAKSDFSDITNTAVLIKTAKANEIMVALAPSWAILPSDNTLTPTGFSTTTPALQRFWSNLNPKPSAIAIGNALASENAINLFGQQLRSNTTLRIPTLGTVHPDSTEAFARNVPQSPFLCCALELPPPRSGTANPFETFIQSGSKAVHAAMKETMTPLAILTADSSSQKPAPYLAWQSWAAMAMGFKGIILAAPNLPAQHAPFLPTFKDISGLRPFLSQLIRHEDFLGLSPILGKVYPGDITRLFYNPKTKQFVIAVVLSPDRPATEPITLRGGNVQPLGISPELATLCPGQGGLYQMTLNSKTVSVLNEAHHYTAMPRHLRDELFLPTFGNRFTVLADESQTPQMLYCSEPVALLMHPNIILSPLANAKPLIVENSSRALSFRTTHVSGYTLYRIATTNRFQRLVLLEENGSVPGYDMRASSIANIAVTNNGICPRPAKKGSTTLPADQCSLQYDLNALRAIGGLPLSYPIFFQFDGGNTAGQSDNRFFVWAGAGDGKMTERVSPRQPVPLVFLKAEDSLLKIGMPYNASAATQPVLRRWSFFTWVRPQKPATSK